jgi:membrane protease YdiL (CAAX protease family)
MKLRDRVEKTSGQAPFILIMISVGLLLSIFAGQSGTLLFYIVVLITLWCKRWDWGYFGVMKPASWPETIIKAFLFSIILFILIDFLVQPLLELYLEKIDLSEVSSIEGDLLSYILFITLGWTLGGFCEEVIFRGYIVKRLAVIFGDTKRSWLLSAIIASTAFGFVHTYQGPAGIITTAIIGFALALIFIYNRKNLMLPILSHGIYNMIAITLIYLGKARVITDWVLEFIN